MPQEILVLALSAGMASADLAAAIDKLKESSKSIGSHKRRQLFWDAYVNGHKANTLDDGAYAFLKYSADTSQDDPEGAVEVVELTKRQRGLMSGGGVDVMGPKFKPPRIPNPRRTSLSGPAAAQTAWDDLMHGEACVYVTRTASSSAPDTSASCAKPPGDRSRR